MTFRTTAGPEYDNLTFDRINNDIDNRRHIFQPTNNPPLPENDPLTSPITEEELMNVLPFCGKTAPGPDGIPYQIIQQYPAAAITALLKIYNSSLQYGYVPGRWKHAHILMFAKQGKDRSDVGNYRPISLTPTICKIIEKILVNRLQPLLNNILPPSQAGFRPGINITDQLLKVYTDLENMTINRSFTTIMMALDIHKAFDTVWLNGLRWKMDRLDIPNIILRWTSDLLRDRTA